MPIIFFKKKFIDLLCFDGVKLQINQSLSDQNSLFFSGKAGSFKPGSRLSFEFRVNSPKNQIPFITTL